METPVISVIVPIFNQEKYIEQCLVSLFNQASEKTEFIIINDGSTDRSLEICNEVLRKFNVNAKLIDQKNHGLIGTRSIGLGLANGEYIVSVDSDDVLLENTLPRLLDLIERHNPDIICYNATKDLETRKPAFSYPFESGTVFSGDGKYELYKLLCGTDKMNNVWTKCVRRSIFLDKEVYQDIENISNGEDLYQSLVLVDRAKTILFVDEVMYYWRQTVGSMSRKYNPKFFISEKKVCKRRLEYARKWSKEGNGELVESAEHWICKILRDISRKAFISDEEWSYIRDEIKKLRNDEFYRTYYLNTNKYRDKRDMVLKSPLPVMRLFKIIYRITGRV